MVVKFRGLSAGSIEFAGGRSMGIRFSCPNGHKLNVKTFLAGKRGVCPQCGARFIIPEAQEPEPLQLPHSLSINQKQHVELFSPVYGESMSLSDPPSMIIDVVEPDALRANIGSESMDIRDEVLAPVADMPAPTAIEPQPLRESSQQPFPQSFSQPLIETPSTPPAARATFAARPQRRYRLQIVVSILLFVLVVVLGIVLVSVLRRDRVRSPSGRMAAIESSKIQRVLVTANRA
jgi:hypothetical protein